MTKFAMTIRKAISWTVLGIWAVSSVPVFAQSSPLPSGKVDGSAIVVVGEAEVSAEPDMAEIQVGVVTLAASPGEALQANNAAVQKLFETLEGRKVPKKDMQTSGFSVSPDFKRGPRGQQLTEIVGYRVRNQVSLKIRQLAILGELLNDLVKDGANQVHGVSLSVSDSSRILDTAREKAIADARRKAEIYANAAGVKAGKVRRIDAEEEHSRQPTGLSHARSAADSVPIATGERVIHVRVVAAFAIE
jgi:uncharacterized protein